jgi:hypothetical protein
VISGPGAADSLASGRCFSSGSGLTSNQSRTVLIPNASASGCSRAEQMAKDLARLNIRPTICSRPRCASSPPRPCLSIADDRDRRHTLLAGDVRQNRLRNARVVGRRLLMAPVWLAPMARRHGVFDTLATLAPLRSPRATITGRPAHLSARRACVLPAMAVSRQLGRRTIGTRHAWGRADASRCRQDP